MSQSEQVMCSVLLEAFLAWQEQRKESKGEGNAK